ncbi:hypothetical protein M758_2G060600 [Ceratodon purpureus]|nr:hypothetical protein M758_2G060600 [Ceratodon purpureus]
MTWYYFAMFLQVIDVLYNFLSISVHHFTRLSRFCLHAGKHFTLFTIDKNMIVRRLIIYFAFGIRATICSHYFWTRP